MAEQYAEATMVAEPDGKKLALVGGFVGTVLGSRRGRAGAVVGGLVGGTLGYLAGSATSPPDVGRSVEEPVVVTVDETGDDIPDETGTDGVDDDTSEE